MDQKPWPKVKKPWPQD